MVIEQTIKRPDVATAAHLLLKGGQIEKASRSYSRAIEADPQLNDPELAGILDWITAFVPLYMVWRVCWRS